jgi:hypothetical protein
LKVEKGNFTIIMAINVNKRYYQDGYCLPAIPKLVNLHMFYPELKPDDMEAAKLYQDFFIKEKFISSMARRRKLLLKIGD